MAKPKVKVRQPSAQHLKQLIHIAAAQLDIDKETRQARQKQLTGKASTANMTVPELLTVKRWLASLGWTPTPAARHGKKPSVIDSKQKLLDKIEALLADAGRPWGYLLDRGGKPKSMLEHLADGKQRLEFCTCTDLRTVVQALEVDKKRRQAR